MSFAFMESPRTSSLIEDRSSHLGYGKNSATPSERRSVSPLVSTRRLTARQNGPIRNSRRPSGAWHPPIRQLGVSNLRGLSMPTIVSPPQPPGCPPSKHLWATNHLSFRPLKVSTLSPLSSSIYGGVDAPGEPPGPLFFAQLIAINAWRTVTGPPHLPTPRDKRFGCRPGLFRSGLSLRSYLPPSLVRLL